MTSDGYLRFPHVHDDLIVFGAEDDLWLAPVAGGRAWRLTADGCQVANPRFSPDGTRIAWTSWRDGRPEVYVTSTQGGAAQRLSYWGDQMTRTHGWTAGGEVLAVTAAGEGDTVFSWAYTMPLDGAPSRLPFGPVAALAISADEKALLTGRFNTEIFRWKRYRGGTRGSLWTASAASPKFNRVLDELPGQYGDVMLIGGRLVFTSDHEGTANVYSAALDGTGLRRHTDHDGFYVRHASTDGRRVVYAVAGEIWLLDSLDGEARKLDVTLGGLAQDRSPRMITAADHLGSLSCDQTGQASAVEVRGTVHWLTHKDGPARALHVDAGNRARLPKVLGEDGAVVFAADDGIRVAGGERTPVLIPVEGAVTCLAASPDGATVAAATHDGKLWLADVASGEVREVTAASDGPADGAITGLTWSPDSAWLAWSQPGPRPMCRIRLAKRDGTVIDVTDGRFADTDPVFTLDGLYLVFLSRRSFDPVYDAQLFDMSFPYGSRPYLVTLGALTPSPFGPLPAGRPLTDPEDSSERSDLTVDASGISSRVVAVPVPEARYSRLRAVKGGVAWLREPLRGVLGESAADVDADAPRPALERFEIAKREVCVLCDEVDWFETSGDGTRLVIRDKGDLRVVASASKDGDEPAVTVDLSRARFLGDPAALWRHAFGEMGRVVRREYWTRDLSGVDWDGVLDAYRPVLDRVRCESEFIDLMWDVVGELGTSHAYVLPAAGPPSPTVGQLGADGAVDADGRWVVTRVLPGESSDPRASSPLAAPGVAVFPGDAVLAVDGQPVDPVHGPWPLLTGTAGKPVSLTVSSGSGSRDVVVVPMRDERRLRYQDWVASRRALVRSLSDGRLGYLHIPDMMGEGWSHFSRDLRSEMRHEGLIMDVRRNSGGHISELVVARLAARVIAWDVARWWRPVSYPQDSRRGALVTLADWAAGSDGDIVTAAIKSLGLGPVVGTRTWGGVIGYEEPFELVDGTRITVPQLAFAFNDYGWGVENYGVDPDVEVLTTPDDWAAGRDPQIEIGVRMALEALDKCPASTPPDPSTGPRKTRPPLPPRA